ncbi:alpha/beta fold hydrolase [Lentzea sp. NPDC051838]|uniref:alpha/beta fold hydrolase n=1 Tax=Lentzea sp. NPDC051838 TaxID=3154849 RepID=UPI0034402047
MTRLVFVHGIGGVRDTDRERAAWLEALLIGARQAGHSQFAATLDQQSGPEVVFANYADLFAKPGAQTDGEIDLNEREAMILADLLREAITVQLTLPHEAAAQNRLRHADGELHTEGAAQGVGNIVRRTVNAATTLLGLGPLRKAGQWATGKMMVRDLAQVARYLARAEHDASGSSLDERIRARVMDALGDSPTIVVAHSLGSVVCLETLHQFTGTVPLLVTLGSPIAMRTVVLSRLRPTPPRAPESVQRWLNFWDRDDIIAARPQLETDVAANSQGVAPHSSRVDSDGMWVHPATKYLQHSSVAGPVAEVAARFSADSQ